MAEEVYLESMTLFRRLYGETQPLELLDKLNNLGVLYRLQGKWDMVQKVVQEYEDVTRRHGIHHTDDGDNEALLAHELRDPSSTQPDRQK